MTRWLLALATCLFCPVVHAQSHFVFPPDAGVVDVTLAPYDAKGDDDRDDTAAIQKALDDHPSGGFIIFLPDGEYRISDTLRWPMGKPGGGDDAKRTVLQGQSTAGAILKLIDKAPGFADPANGKAMINTGVKPAQRFRNGVRTLTLDTGKANPGAVGLQFNASNQGSVRNVLIRSGDGVGPIGLDLGYTDEIGPLLVKDVEVRGFDIGVRTKHAVNSMTFEGLTLIDQNVAGFSNDGQVVSIRQLRSRQKAGVPALVNVSGVGLVTLIESSLTEAGGAGGAATAIDNKGAMLARDVRIAGYAHAIQGRDGRTVDGDIDEFSSSKPLAIFPSAPRTLRLAIEETPVPADDPLDHWAGPHQFGGNCDDKLDDTEAVQKAIDSGASTIYFPHPPAGGQWIIDGEVIVPATVRRITAFEGRLTGKGTLKVTGDAPQPLVIERMETSYQKLKLVLDTHRPVAISGVIWGGGGIVAGEGATLFFEDFCGGAMEFRDARVWARQLNLEPSGPHVVNDAGSLWILGYKTERSGELARTTNGGRTEILGLFAYATSGPKVEPMFAVSGAGSAMSASFAEACFNGKPFWTILEQSQAGQMRQLYRGQLPGRAGGSIYPLIVAIPGDGAELTPQIPRPPKAPAAGEP